MVFRKVTGVAGYQKISLGRLGALQKAVVSFIRRDGHSLFRLYQVGGLPDFLEQLVGCAWFEAQLGAQKDFMVFRQNLRRCEEGDAAGRNQL